MVDKQVHEEYKKLAEDMTQINTKQSGGVDGLKGFYEELLVLREEHEEYKKLAEDMAKINTRRGGGADGLKGFYAELVNSTENNVERIEKGSGVRQRVLDNNGRADAVKTYQNGSHGREIQDKCGYTYYQHKENIASGKYDGQIYRINKDNPIFSNPEQLEELQNLAKKHNIKIEKGKVSEAELKKVSTVAIMEGNIRIQVGLDSPEQPTAPVTATVYVASKEVAHNVNKTETKVKDVGNKLVEKSGEAVKYAQNAGNDFTEGAKNAVVGAIVPLTVEAVSKVMDVAQGKVTLGEASKKMAKSTINVAVAGGTNKLIIENVSRTLSTSNNPILRGLANSGQIGQLVAIASIVQESAVEFVNGEITGEEFIEQIGKKGTTMVVGMIGGEIVGEIGTIIGGIVGSIALPGAGTAGGAVAGKVIGEILGTVITTVACSAVVAVFDTVKHMKDYKLTESHIRKIEKDALKEMENQREKFKSIMQREFQVWDEKVEEGFNQILLCACKETFNINGVTEGIDKILSVFGKSVAFHSLDEYEEQLEQTLVLKF